MTAFSTLVRQEAAVLRRSRLAKVGLMAILLLPLLYGTLYLWAFWDPTQHLDRMPVALVNADQPVTADGRRVAEGADLTRALLRRHTFNWRLATTQQAVSGVAEGRYYLAVVVPPEFSADVASPMRAATGAPRQAPIQLFLDDANSYLASTLARNVLAEVRSATSAQVGNADIRGLLTGLAHARSGFLGAASGTSQLAKGVGAAYQGSAQLMLGADRLAVGAAGLARHEASGGDGARSLASGAKSLRAGAGRLAKAAGRLKTAIAALPGQTTRLNTGAQQVSAGATQLASGIGSLAEQAPALTSAQATALASLKADAAAYPDDASLQQAVAALAAASRQSSGALQAVAAQAGAAQQLASGAGQVAAGTQQLADAAPALAGGAASLASGAENAVTGARQVAMGTSRMATATGRLAAGARQVASGASGVAEGAQWLADGTGHAASGASTLRQRLAGGARDIPALNGPGRSGLAKVVASPVSLAVDNYDPAGSYGAGFAPYFIGIALWIGGTFAFGILRPVARRRNGAANEPLQRTLAGYLPLLVMGLIEMVALIAALHYGLGLNPLRPLGAVAFLALTVASFAALLQLLHARLGAAGRLTAVVLLVVQLTSGGGTYPIQTTPAFFRAMHPFMPLTYVITGLRRLLSGGDLGPVWASAEVLAAIALVSLALTWWTARRGRDASAVAVTAIADGAPGYAQS